MLIINNKPPQTEAELAALYARLPREGLVYSGFMCGERYEQSADFDESWSCPAITWSAGGEETYFLAREPAVTVRSAGALMLAGGARYAYVASARPFRSNMIVFPLWIAQEAADAPLEGAATVRPRFATRLFMPDLHTNRLMQSIAARCARGETAGSWYEENVALLYDMILNAQNSAAAALRDIAAAKQATRAELARRVDRAQQFILQSYDDAVLDLKAIAREACLSPYHLIRVFKALSGETPIQFLTRARMAAALRLLSATRWAVAEIATAVGYSDRTSFFRAFRRHHGCSPSAVDRP